MAFFGLQEAHLAGENRFIDGRKSKLRIKSAGVFSNELRREILLNSKKNYFFVKKAVKQFIIYFPNDEGCE